MNQTKMTMCLVLLFSFFLLTTSIASAATGMSLTTPRPFSDTEDQYVEDGVSLISPPEDNFNLTLNVSVNNSLTSDYAEETNTWVTQEGDIENVDDIQHNDLGGLQGGTSSERYHLTNSQSTYIGTNLFNFLLVASGPYDWTAESPWLDFNGSHLDWNESKLQEEAEVTMQQEVITVTSSGGVAAGFSGTIDFEIKEIMVNTTSGTKFRFEAIEASTGLIIDKDRKLHDTIWRIEKNYPINDAVNFSITAASPDDSFTITIKYLDNFE